MESSLSMGGAIILIAVFEQNYILEQQHNISRSCDLVSYNALWAQQTTCFLSKYLWQHKESFILSEYARLYQKDSKEI